MSQGTVLFLDGRQKCHGCPTGTALVSVRGWMGDGHYYASRIRLCGGCAEERHVVIRRSIDVDAGRGRQTFEAGKRYRVEPRNPQKKKHRGRTGVLVGYVHDKGYFQDAVRLRFDDTGRIGTAEFCDLVEVDG